jgi:hypothetical protein
MIPKKCPFFKPKRGHFFMFGMSILLRHSVSYHALYNNGEHTNHIEKRFTNVGKNKKRTRPVESTIPRKRNMPGVQQYPD